MPSGGGAHAFFCEKRSHLQEEARQLIARFGFSEGAAERLANLGSVAAIAQISGSLGVADGEEDKLASLVDAAKAQVEKSQRLATPLATPLAPLSTPSVPKAATPLRKTRLLNPPHLIPPPLEKLNLQEVPGTVGFPSFRPQYCHAKRSARRNFQHFWTSTAMPNSNVDTWAEQVYSRGAHREAPESGRAPSSQKLISREKSHRSPSRHDLQMSPAFTHTQELLQESKIDSFGNTSVPPKAWWSFAFKNSGRLRKDCGHLLRRGLAQSRAQRLY